MNWVLNFSDRSLKFIKKNNLTEEEITSHIVKAINKLQGEDVNVDIKKMKGKWNGFIRIRIGKVRVITDISFGEQKVYVDIIDFRGGVYK